MGEWNFGCGVLYYFVLLNFFIHQSPVSFEICKNVITLYTHNLYFRFSFFILFLSSVYPKLNKIHPLPKSHSNHLSNKKNLFFNFLLFIFFQNKNIIAFLIFKHLYPRLLKKRKRKKRPPNKMEALSIIAHFSILLEIKLFIGFLWPKIFFSDDSILLFYFLNFYILNVGKKIPKFEKIIHILSLSFLD